MQKFKKTGRKLTGRRKGEKITEKSAWNYKLDRNTVQTKPNKNWDGVKKDLKQPMRPDLNKWMVH